MNQGIMLISHQIERMATVCKALTRLGMNVYQIQNMDDMKAGLVSYRPAFVLLDVDSRDMGPLLAEITESVLRPVPYVMAAVFRSDDDDRVTLLNLGADACVERPVVTEEVLAVVRAVLRRERRIARLHLGRVLPRIKHREMMIDPLLRVVVMRGEAVTLTAKEFDILYLLACHTGTVLTKQEIYETVWGTNQERTSSCVADQISSIRRKLGLSGKDAHYIRTVIGVGYRFGGAE